jgi:hypothetical protein
MSTKDATNARGMKMLELKVDGYSELLLNLLNAQGLKIPRTLDMDVPELPDDITSIDAASLMHLASQYIEYRGFLETQVALAKNAETEAETSYDQLVNRKTLVLSTGKSTEKATILKASVATDPDVEKLHLVFLQVHMYRNTLEAYLDKIDAYHWLINSEVKRRSGYNAVNRYTA